MSDSNDPHYVNVHLIYDPVGKAIRQAAPRIFWREKDDPARG